MVNPVAGVAKAGEDSLHLHEPLQWCVAALRVQQVGGFLRGILVKYSKAAGGFHPGEVPGKVCHGVHWEERQAGTSGVTLVLCLAMFLAAKKNPLAPRATSAPPGASTQLPGKHFPGKHLCVNDFNEFNQFLRCFCCCFQYLCFCHYFLVLSRE